MTRPTWLSKTGRKSFSVSSSTTTSYHRRTLRNCLGKYEITCIGRTAYGEWSSPAYRQDARRRLSYVDDASTPDHPASPDGTADSLAADMERLNLSPSTASQVVKKSGWWGPEPRPAKKGYSSESLKRQLERKAKHLLDERIHDGDLTKPGIYYLASYRYRHLHYVGQTRRNLFERLSRHITMAFSDKCKVDEPLSLPLVCTTADDWEIQILPVEENGKYPIIERLNALETFFIVRKQSSWPRGLNLQMPLTFNSLEALPTLQDRFLSLWEDKHLEEELFNP